MLRTIITVDDFYSDPHAVRKIALSSEFSVKGNFPGRRTVPFVRNQIREAIQDLLKHSITHWPTEIYNASFQITTSSDHSWIHADQNTNVAGVLYLTPDAPLSSGTSFYRHRATGLFHYPEHRPEQQICEFDARDDSKWEQTDYVANIFNRLVIFDSRRFHRSRQYFGNNLTDGRLFQTFFFNVSRASETSVDI